MSRREMEFLAAFGMAIGGWMGAEGCSEMLFWVTGGVVRTCHLQWPHD